MSDSKAGSISPKVRFEINKTFQEIEIKPKDKEDDQNNVIHELLQTIESYDKDWSKIDAETINTFEPIPLNLDNLDKERYNKAWNWFRNTLSKDIWNTESVAKFLIYASPYEIQKFWRYTYHTHTHLNLNQWLDIVNYHFNKINSQDNSDYQINPSAILTRNMFRYVKFSDHEIKCQYSENDINRKKETININSTGNWNKTREQSIKEDFESYFQYNQGTSIKTKANRVLKENLKYIDMLKTLDQENTDAEINFGDNIDAKINLSINSTDLEKPAEIIIVTKENPDYDKHRTEIKNNYLYEELINFPYSLYVWTGLLKFNRDKISNWILTGKLRWYSDSNTLVIPQSWFTLKINYPTISFITRTLKINWNYRRRKRKFKNISVSEFEFADLFNAI